MNTETNPSRDNGAGLGPLAGTLVKSIPNLSYMLLTFFWLYLTIGYRVRKTRRAFEKQLIAQGMTKEDAEKLSACFKTLGDQVVNTVKQGLRGAQITLGN